MEERSFTSGGGSSWVAHYFAAIFRPFCSFCGRTVGVYIRALIRCSGNAGINAERRLFNIFSWPTDSALVGYGCCWL